jgi:flagellar hook assembly protein FlgD
LTVINYQLPASRQGGTINNVVNLKVYAALGKEVATLVNEKQNAGSYSVEFNGEGLPSGVYYYKLEAGDFVETKRMVLLK